MCAVSGDRPGRRPLHRLQRGIEFVDARDRIFQIVHLDAEMIDPRTAPFAPRNAIQPDIAVADDHGACRPWLARRLHAEQGFVEARVDRVMIRCDRDVIDFGTHGRRTPLANYHGGLHAPDLIKSAAPRPWYSP